MTQAAQFLLTAEAFWADYGDQRAELIAGKVREKMPVGGIHGKIATRLSTRLSIWAANHGGEVGIEAGFVLGRNPDLVRAPDVFYIAPQHLPDGGTPEGFWLQAPDLAIEVVSPSESANDIAEKVMEYLEAGVAVVWVIYPKSQQVMVHTPDYLTRTLRGQDTLQDQQLLPAFHYALRDLFG
jgi:Uma2 family endonuclease